MEKGFFSLLEKKCLEKESFLCVGIDPRVSSIDELEDVCISLINNTHKYACCFKPNIAFFEKYGGGGYSILKRVIKYIHSIDDLVILDCKRGDVGSTADSYAQACFDELEADCVTLSPYLGFDSIKSFVTQKYEGKGVFILCCSSNDSAHEIQFPTTYLDIAKLCADKWNDLTPLLSQPLGLVVGATKPYLIKSIRSINEKAWILTPGIGIQGGILRKIINETSNKNKPPYIIVPISRILSNSKNQEETAKNIKNEINYHLSNSFVHK